jgi:hypothetical protein
MISNNVSRVTIKHHNDNVMGNAAVVWLEIFMIMKIQVVV